MGLLHSRSRSQQRFKMLVNVCLDIFWTTGHFVTKPGMVMQCHKPECHAEKLVHCVQCQGHSEGLYNQNMTISVVSSKLLVHSQPNLIWQYSIISLGFLWKNEITAFKVKVTVKVQNVSECLSVLNHRTFCYQSPRWGAVDTEIRVPSVENTELEGSPFKACGRSVHSHTCYASFQWFLPC